MRARRGTTKGPCEMPSVIVDPAVSVNTTLIAAVAGQRIIPLKLWLGQAGGIGFLATTADAAVIAGPRIDASAGATQLAYASSDGGALWDLAVGVGLVFNNGFSSGSIASHVCLQYEVEQT